MGRGKITLTNYPVQLWRSLVLTIQNVIPNVLLVPSPLSSSVSQGCGILCDIRRNGWGLEHRTDLSSFTSWPCFSEHYIDILKRQYNQQKLAFLDLGFYIMPSAHFSLVRPIVAKYGNLG